ncbi:conserved hypothetical protein [Pseudomonas sp. 8Z]|uniref:hypothetical protein n=1 Tax=Pseudomonas sp. 8Z TaxID=2653166 RepID=UPI0012F27038|nr:hypothetical protein [Pseudomonas sp. 8Z]VXC44677.1 conserved hypothetical protein [Pseudomonas sp. 8Z]
MQRASELRVLKQLHEQLQDALRQGHWTRIGEIDASIRVCLQGLAELPTLGEDVQAAKLRLQRLHELARQAGAEECERMRKILLTHREYAEVRSAYMHVDLFQGGS